MDERISRETAFSKGGVPFSSNCLSVNTMLTLIVAGVGVLDAVADAVNVGVGVREGVALAVGVLLGVDVGVRDGASVAVKVGVLD